MTLMHVAEPMAVLREARRITRVGGTVVAAEPDNLAQRWYFDGHLEEITRTLSEVSRAYRDARLPADSCIGPRAASLLRAAGLVDVTVRVQAAQVSRVSPASESAARWRSVLATMSAAAGLAADAPAVLAAEQAGARWLEAVGPEHLGQSLDTVPVFLSAGRVPADG